MDFSGKSIWGVKVLNIFEENPAAIEKMVAAALEEIHKGGHKILDIHTTPDNMIFILGE